MRCPAATRFPLQLDVGRLSQTSTQRVAIVGGGLSGLATAVSLQLADPSCEITLWEASRRVGGVIDTERVDGFVIDRGADMFALSPPAALQLLEQLGVADRLIRPQPDGRGARIVDRGELVDVPDGFVLMRATKLSSVLTTPLLSLAGKLRLLTEPLRRPLTSEDPTEDVSVAQFVRHRLGEEVLQRLVAPLVGGIYTADVERLSMKATMGPLAKMERDHGSLTAATWSRRRSGADDVERGSSGARYEQFRAFPGGMIELINTLAAALPPGTIQTNCRVDQLRREGPTWQLQCGEQSHSFDQLVVAVPPVAAARLLSDIASQAASELSGIESASTAIVVLALRRDEIQKDIRTFGFVVPPSEHRKILAGSFASNKFAGRAPDDHVLVRCFFGGMLQPQLLELDDDALVALACDELRELIGLSGQPVLHRVVRWNNAMPQYHVGHLQRVERIETDIDSIPGLWLINNALHGVGIAPIIQAAGKLVQRMCTE